ncbi:Ankyrin repeat domain-containing protein 6 [Mactra antiquata]
MWRHLQCASCFRRKELDVIHYELKDDIMDLGSQRILNVSDRLRHSASKGDIEDVSECLQAGAKFDPDQDGRTALHYAALNGYVDVARFLIEKGCDINLQDASGYTALHRAVSQGHVDVISVLLERSCDINTQDEHGNSAIHEAAWNGYSKTLELLVKYNVHVSVVNKAGFTALHLSAQNGHNESTRVLLYAGCNSDLKNNYGDTSLHTAARYGHAGVTRILISARSKLNEQNKNGDTALHIAAALKRRKIAKLLVESGIDVCVRNKQNETAVDVAKRKDHEEIIVIIQSYCRPYKAPLKEVNFDTNVYHMDGPVVIPNMDIPEKPDTKVEKGKRFLFFKKKKKDKEPKTPQLQRNGTPQRLSGHNASRCPNTPVQGFFSKYVPREGVQYYRDLAGNVKQGPVGYTPTCNCLPAIHRLEKQVHDTQDHVYGQMYTSNRAIQDHINQVDHKSTMRVQALEKYTHDRFSEEENLCRQRINAKYSEYPPQDHVKSQIQNWLEQKLEGYGHCLHHHHDDTALPNENIFSEVHETANGRLFKSRSDETLSQSDNHSGRFRKREFYESRQQAMQQIRAWQVPSYSKDRNRIKVTEKQNRHNEVPKRSQSRPQLSGEPTDRQRHYPVEPRIEVKNRAPSRSAERPHDDDNTYMTMNGAKKSGNGQQPVYPQPQVYPSNRQTGGGPNHGIVNNSAPKSRESSPYASFNGISRSQTDGNINRNVSVSSPWQHNTNTASYELKNTNSFSDKNLNERKSLTSQTYSPVKSASSTSFITPAYRNSTSSDHFMPTAPKPTFSTFGYDDSQKTAVSNVNSGATPDQEQNVVTPRSNEAKTDDLNSQSSLVRQSSQHSYGFTTSGPEEYVEMKVLSPRLHQRSASSDGLLETDIDRVNVKRSESEDRNLVRNMTQSPNIPRSTSELHGSFKQNVASSYNSVPKQDSYAFSSPNPIYSSSPYSVQSSQNYQGAVTPKGTVSRQGAGPRQGTGPPPTPPKPSVRPSPNPYSSVREVQRGNEVKYNGNLNTLTNSNANSGSEPLYSSVRDVKLNKDSNHNVTVTADVHNSEDIYYHHRAVNGLNGQQNQLEPRSKTAYQTYLTETPHYSNENLYRESSPNICNNSKEDSSSNPDSGYSSKIYGNRVNSTTPVSYGSTPSSSFSTDRGLHSNTNSPQSQYSNADYECLPKRQYEDDMQTHVQSWYQRKLQETTQKVYDSWRSERSPGQAMTQQQNSAQKTPSVRYFGNSDYAKIDYTAVSNRLQSNTPMQSSFTSTGSQNHQFATYTMHGSDV